MPDEIMQMLSNHYIPTLIIYQQIGLSAGVLDFLLGEVDQFLPQAFSFLLKTRT